MIRFTKALALAATLLAIPSMASALGIEVVQVTDDATGNANNGTLAVGASVTFDIRMTFTGTEPQICGLSADLTGMDLADATGARQLGLQLVNSGSVTESLGIDPVGDGSVISGAIPNNNGNLAVERFSINHLNPQAYTVNMFDGIRVAGADGDGLTDYGLGGALVSGGDFHFEVTLQNVFTSADQGALANLQFSVLALDFQGNEIASTGDTFALTVVPEPGTALLMGLGLAGLATVRRR